MAKDFFLSIGVNGYNEQASVKRMLESVFKSSLWKATPPEKRELVFYADGCTDGTVGIVKLLKRVHSEIRLIESAEKRGFAYGRNRLVREMNPEAGIFFFFDADNILGRKTIEMLKEALEKDRALDVAVAELKPAAIVIEKRNRGLLAKLSVGKYERRIEQNLRYITGAGYAVRSKVIRKIDLPEELQGNVDTFLALKIGRERIRRIKEALIFWREPTTLRDYYRKGFRRFFSNQQLRRHFPNAQTAKPIKKQAKIFLSLPLSQKIAALGVKGAMLLGKMQAKHAWKQHLRGKRVDGWKRTSSDRSPSKRKRY